MCGQIGAPSFLKQWEAILQRFDPISMARWPLCKQRAIEIIIINVCLS
jgi:hypothetical protein